MIYFVKHHANEVLNINKTFRQKHNVNQKLLKMIEQVKKHLRITLEIIFIAQQKKRTVRQTFNQEHKHIIQLQNEIYVLKKQPINERNFNALINLFKNFSEFFSSSKTTLVFNDISIIIQSKRFVKHVDFKIFIDNLKKK